MKVEARMSQNRQESIEQDRDRIDVSEEHECRFWTEKLGVSYSALKAIVLKVGPRASDVKAYLGK
jgi:hypothetical protein